MNNFPTTMSPEYLEKEKKNREIQQKEWDKCTDSEKIEKLKMFVIDFNYMNNTIATLQSEIHRLKLHSHKENGEIVVPISSVNSQGIGGLIGNRSNTLN